MSKEAVIPASEGHRSFGKLLKRVYQSEEHLIVERDGFPVAVIMSYQEYEKLRSELALAALNQLGRAMGREIEERGLSEEDVMNMLEESKKKIYQEQYGRGR